MLFSCTHILSVNLKLLQFPLGEMVPDDEPLDLEDPPSVFISYQWGVQDKAKELKDYLTDSGFKCWMDIGKQFFSRPFFINTNILSCYCAVYCICTK